MAATLLNYRIMMRKKGKNLQIFNTQAYSMEDALKAALGVAHARDVSEMEELCIHEYGAGNSVRMLDAVTGTVEITTEVRPPKDAPRVGQVIKSNTKEADIQEKIDAIVAETTTVNTLSGVEEQRAADKAAAKSAPVTQVKLRKYTLVMLACIEPAEKKGYGGRDG